MRFSAALRNDGPVGDINVSDHQIFSPFSRSCGQVPDMSRRFDSLAAVLECLTQMEDSVRHETDARLFGLGRRKGNASGPDRRS